MALQVNLEKATQSLVLSLEKAGITTPPILDVGFGMDVSASFEDEHLSGITNDLLTRLVPWGLAFDPDKKVDCFTFSNGPSRVDNPGPVDAKNYENYVANKIIGRVNGWNGGTDYSYLIERVLQHFGWMPKEQESAGLLGRLFGKKSDAGTPAQKRRSIIIIATDGDNNDKERTRQVLKQSEARKDEVYFIFLGISNQGSTFPFLESIGDQFGNTGYVPISDLRKFVAKSDEELNALLISDELLDWLKR